MVRTSGSSSVKSDSARAGMEGKSQCHACAAMAIPREGQGQPGMAQRAHTDHSDPSCQPGENALSSQDQFGIISS